MPELWTALLDDLSDSAWRGPGSGAARDSGRGYRSPGGRETGRHRITLRNDGGTMNALLSPPEDDSDDLDEDGFDEDSDLDEDGDEDEDEDEDDDEEEEETWQVLPGQTLDFVR